MRLRILLTCSTGFCLVLALAAGAGAEDAAAPPPDGDSADAPHAQRDAEPERPPLTWRVRRTSQVLEEHFEPERFRLKRGEHFIVLHDTHSRRAATRAALLDLTYQRFYEAFGDFYDLNRAEHPLVCVLFSEEEDFARYARLVDRLDMSWAGGYYSSRTNRMVLYDDEPPESGSIDHPCDHCHDDDGGASTAQADADQDDGRRRTVSDLEPDETQQLLLAAADEVGAAASPSLNLASTTHEAAHQLAFNTGLQRRGVMYPFWVSEGLACAFETNHPGEPFGLGKINPTRLGDLRRAIDDGTVMDLERFLTMTRPPTSDRQQLNTVYAQAWALFRYLYLHEREALGGYLETLAALRPGRRSPETLREEFVAAFGPVQAMQRRWDAHIETLR